MRTRFFAELYRRNPLLTFVGWLHVVALLAALVGYFTDGRFALGINAWTRSIEIMASLTVYLWTIAWFSRYIRRPRWAIRSVSVVIAVAVLIETACVLLQAGRGTALHGSAATDFDAAIRWTAYIMIGISAVMTAIIFVMFKRPAGRLPPAYLWGIRAGLAVFLAGTVIGGALAAANGLGVGDVGVSGAANPDWSGGHLRLAQGLALHALQILPLVGFAISRWMFVRTGAAKLALLTVLIALYVALIYASCRQAVAGTHWLQEVTHALSVQR